MAGGLDIELLSGEDYKVRRNLILASVLSVCFSLGDFTVKKASLGGIDFQNVTPSSIILIIFIANIYFLFHYSLIAMMAKNKRYREYSTLYSNMQSIAHAFTHIHKEESFPSLTDDQKKRLITAATSWNKGLKNSNFYVKANFWIMIFGGPILLGAFGCVCSGWKYWHLSAVI